MAGAPGDTMKRPPTARRSSETSSFSIFILVHAVSSETDAVRGDDKQLRGGI